MQFTRVEYVFSTDKGVLLLRNCVLFISKMPSMVSTQLNPSVNVEFVMVARPWDMNKVIQREKTEFIIVVEDAVAKSGASLIRSVNSQDSKIGVLRSSSMR